MFEFYWTTHMFCISGSKFRSEKNNLGGIIHPGQKDKKGASKSSTRSKKVMKQIVLDQQLTNIQQ